MNYQEASQYWIKKDKTGVKAEKEQLFKLIESFILSHNTMALATGYEDEVRCTPLEYNYYDGAFYIFSEGGMKFKYLEKNKNVAASIFDSYSGFGNIHSLQIQGKIEIIEEDNEEYLSIIKRKGINLEALKKMNASFHLLKLIPSHYDFLESSLKKDGFSNRQEYIFD